ncbi:MAG TPA: ATP-binding protein [Proteiniphilum sp.]|nr:ATP-binding protein [Proteiniphilum sp.]HPD86381.1 ATP-binding protein [Proteiniphilum sp.]HPJ49167.1 ATP-binding protein [Proteiniphilum sp.]HPR19173.1 ATP-binding protein [Proteiniphilum sp.]
MGIKFSFKSRILLTFSLIIALFTAGIIYFEQQQLRKERTESLQRMLDNDALLIARYLEQNQILHGMDTTRLKELLQYMQPELRLTLIDLKGKVLYDNRLEAAKMENHLLRPEVQESIAEGSGSDIRRSTSNQLEYLYHVRYSDNLFVRVALPYDVELRSFIHSGNSFAYYILLFFIVSVLMMIYFSDRFSRSIRELRAFSQNVKSGAAIPPSFVFADDEVGEVSAAIVENYNLLQENRRRLATEREKLLQHFQFSEEGIAIFSEERKEVYANSHFLQYLNLILESPTLVTENLFADSAFKEVVGFLDRKDEEENVFSKRMEKSGKMFNVRVIIFEDRSFELYISDITRVEKRRLLKQEMTNNIAHELRTPVTSIRGYLETILGFAGEGVDVRLRSFLDRAYLQTIRLSELIQDISMLTKIEEASDRFEMEPVNIGELLQEMKGDLSEKLMEKSDRFMVDVGEDVVLYGSRTLLYSIFRNLTENAIAYAGEGIEIVIRCHNENDDAYFFEFHDNGPGLEEKHLVRIFERFYRVNEGRTRKTGGSGLGLSIVKNAVLFHKGSILARNRTEGGLSFLITFPKKRS